MSNKGRESVNQYHGIFVEQTQYSLRILFIAVTNNILDNADNNICK